MSQLLDIKDMSVRYRVPGGMLSALNKLNLTIDEAETFCLIGESGCGKSTMAFSLMRLLMNGTEEISGSAMFDGVDLLKISEKEMEKVRGKKIGMIFQNPLDSLNPVYRSGTQINEAIMLDGVSRSEATARTVALFKELKIPDAEKRVESFPHELSGGMRQRVMIAMMLSRNPRLLIADEPTTALDVTIEKQILEIFKRLKAEKKTSFLIITHNFGIVAEIADRVGVLYAGDLVESADVFTLFENPRHPYTQSLMRTLPRISKNDGRLETIGGIVPRFIGEYRGCRFANRCRECMERCKNEEPDFVELEKGHFVKCHKAVDLNG